MNIDEETRTAEERYYPGVKLKVMTYTLPSGETFQMLRPIHCADSFVYIGRDVSGDEAKAIWAHHSQLLIESER